MRDSTIHSSPPPPDTGTRRNRGQCSQPTSALPKTTLPFGSSLSVPRAPASPQYRSHPFHCLHSSPDLVMDTDYPSQAGGHMGKSGPQMHARYPSSHILRSGRARARSTQVPRQPSRPRCPAMTPELCFRQAQSCLGREPSLTRMMCRHYGQKGPHTDRQRHLMSQAGQPAPAVSQCHSHSVSPPARAGTLQAATSTMAGTIRILQRCHSGIPGSR